MGDEMGHGGTGRKDYALTSWTPSCARVTVESPGPITRQSERNETANADFHAAIRPMVRRTGGGAGGLATRGWWCLWGGRTGAGLVSRRGG